MNSLSQRSKIYFPSVIGKSRKDLDKLIENLDDYYREWSKVKLDKETGLPKKDKNGNVKTRIVRESKGIIKEIQGKISNRILKHIKLPNNIKGGVKGESNITNARFHKGNRYIFTTDLENFFPSIKVNRVYKTLLNLGFNKLTTHYITRFSTWKGEVPQGIKTSTYIANLVLLETDYKLIEFCKKYNIKYTRYIDDLTFSSQVDFGEKLNEILNIIKQSRLRINWRKTEYKGKQIATGIQLNPSRITAPKFILSKIEEEKLLPKNSPQPYTKYKERIDKVNYTKNNKLMK
ncbi:reverse transcriptase family protein [Capnocytophaga cynodegmi]|uniref:reverse transcriptase family protein n=1 Tax=Capnocytophaga cynodegmi TaxID=28189 RepID=UPI00385F46B3